MSQAISDMRAEFTSRARKIPDIVTVNSMTLSYERSVEDIIAKVEAEEAAKLLKSEGRDRCHTNGDRCSHLSALIKE